MNKKIWLITGISSGLGSALAQTIINKGDFVIGTFRNAEQVKAFNAQNTDKGLGIVMDITLPAQIDEAFNLIKEKFGRIDVLVNNAGFGFAGAIEETSDKEARAVFETNFFGTLQVTQKALPMFRHQGKGHIIQISSHGGFKAFQGFGIYNAAKFAVEGFSEALALELAPLGIKLTIVEPGPFRTNFAGNSFQEAATVIDAYAQTAGAFRQRMKAVNGKQEGHPDKAAEAIYNISLLENPPLRLPLGKIALASINAKMESVIHDLNMFKSIAENAVFDE